MSSVTQSSRKRKYTLDEIKAMDRDMVTPAVVAGVVGCDPYYISVQAKEDPAALGFPVCVVGPRKRGYDTDLVARAIVQSRGMC